MSQGDDTVELRYGFGAYRPGQYRPETTYSGTFSTTWNELFAAVSPLLIDEASDRVVKTALDEFTRRLNLGEIQKNKKLEGYDIRDFSMNNEDFNTVKVQLLALRLLAKSTKKKARSVSDRNVYWMLTPYGETVMMALRAIRENGGARSNKAMQPTADSGG